MNKTEYRFTGKVYSAKAEAMLKECLTAIGYGSNIVTRNELGEVMFATNGNWTEFSGDFIARKILNKTKLDDGISTPRARSTDSRMFINGRYTGAELSCLAYLMLGAPERTQLAKWFGESLVDELIGRPADALKAAQRSVLLEEIKKLETERQFEKDKVSDWFEAEFDKLQAAKNLKDKEIATKYQARIEKLREKLEQL